MIPCFFVLCPELSEVLWTMVFQLGTKTEGYLGGSDDCFDVCSLGSTHCERAAAHGRPLCIPAHPQASLVCFVTTWRGRGGYPWGRLSSKVYSVSTLWVSALSSPFTYLRITFALPKLQGGVPEQVLWRRWLQILPVLLRPDYRRCRGVEWIKRTCPAVPLWQWML